MNARLNLEQFTVRIRDDGQQTTIAAEMHALGITSPNGYFHHLYQHRPGTPPKPAQAELLDRLTTIEQRLGALKPVPVDAKLHAELAALRGDLAASHTEATRIRRGQFLALIIIGVIAITGTLASIAAVQCRPPTPITSAPVTR